MSLPTSGRWAMQQAPGLASRSSPLKCLGKGMDSPRPVGAQALVAVCPWGYIVCCFCWLCWLFETLSQLSLLKFTVCVWYSSSIGVSAVMERQVRGFSHAPIKSILAAFYFL